MICAHEEQKQLKADCSEGMNVNIKDSDTPVLNFYQEAYTK